MMKKIIVYCHGYGSSSESDKVNRLKAVENSEVYAWNIDVDPAVSLPYLFDKIDMEVLLNKLHEPCNIVFVGTSLGAWYASKLADSYGTDAILINPSYDPASSLGKYGVADEVCSKYEPISWNPKYKYFIAKDDDVIDFSKVAENLKAVSAVFVDNSSHRFNGPEFDLVIHAGVAQK